MSTEIQVDERRSTKQESQPADNSRRSFLVRGVATSAGVLVAQSLSWPATAQAQGVGDPQTRLNFIDIQRHENDHVLAVRNAIISLGGIPRPKPTFQNLLQARVHHFFEVSQALENTGVGAYLGAAPAIFNPAILAAAASIALIEGRHAGWLNTFVNARLTTNIFGEEQSFERALTVAEVVAAAGPFVASLNGGPPLTFSATRSEANDIAILNFALALEYLEAEFYNLNVPRFYGHQGL